MSNNNKKLDATQRKLMEIIEQAEKSRQKFAEKAPFDFPCANEFCSGRIDGQIPMASVWAEKKGYFMFCCCCGEETKFTKEEFRALKGKSKPIQQKNSQSPKRTRTHRKKLELVEQEDYNEKYAEYEEEIQKKYGIPA